MICNHCGAVFNGAQCPKCGQPINIKDYSHELETLMAAPQSVPKSSQTVPPRPPRPTPTPPRPVPKPPRPTPKPPFLLPVCAVALIAVGLAGFAIGSSSGKNVGYQQGRAERQEEYEEALVRRYDEGFQTGIESVKREIAATQEHALLYDADTGSISPEGVRQLQLLLNTLLNLKLKTDGTYGVRTRTAVKQFQKAAQLEVTGDVDAETLKQMFYSMDHPLPGIAQVESAQPMPVNTAIPINPEQTIIPNASEASTHGTALQTPNSVVLEEPIPSETQETTDVHIKTYQILNDTTTEENSQEDAP